MTQETTQYAVTLSTHDIKWQGLVSMENIAYISILQNSKVWRGTLKVFVWVELMCSLTSTPRFSKVAMAHLVSPVCVCSYHCRICTRWKLRTRWFGQNPWLQPTGAICAPHISSSSVEHMYCSYDKCTMHLLCICRFCIQHMLMFLSRKSQIEMWEPNIWQNSCGSWVL